MSQTKEKKYKQKKKLKSFVWFHIDNNIEKYCSGGEGGRKKKKIQKNLQSKSKEKNNIRLSWVTDVRILLLTWFPDRLPSLGYPASPRWSLDSMTGTLTFHSGPARLCSCFQYPQLSQLVHFLLLLLLLLAGGSVSQWGLSVTYLYIHRRRVFLGARVDVICGLYT